MRARGCRDEITLCTKVGTGNDPENIGKALAASLDRLGVDSVDMYKLHNPDDTPIAETLAAMTEEVAAGRTRAIGCSNFSAEQLAEALEASAANGLSRFDVIQPPYSLALPDADEDIFPICEREQVAVTSYSPLGAGFLTGKYTPDRSQFPDGLPLPHRARPRRHLLLRPQLQSHRAPPRAGRALRHVDGPPRPRVGDAPPRRHVYPRRRAQPRADR